MWAASCLNAANTSFRSGSSIDDRFYPLSPWKGTVFTLNSSSSGFKQIPRLAWRVEVRLDVLPSKEQAARTFKKEEDRDVFR